jgi:hypothetical protein
MMFRESYIVLVNFQLVDFGIGDPCSCEFDFFEIMKYLRKDSNGMFKGNRIDTVHVHPEGFNGYSSIDAIMFEAFEKALNGNKLLNDICHTIITFHSYINVDCCFFDFMEMYKYCSGKVETCFNFRIRDKLIEDGYLQLLKCMSYYSEKFNVKKDG